MARQAKKTTKKKAAKKKTSARKPSSAPRQSRSPHASAKKKAAKKSSTRKKTPRKRAAGPAKPRNVADYYAELPPWADTFFETLAKVGVIGTSARKAGVDHDTANNWRKNSEEFRRRFDLAFETSNDVLEESILTRSCNPHVTRRYNKDGDLIEETQRFETSLTIHVAKTRLAHRGYNPDAEVEQANAEELAKAIREGIAGMRATVPTTPEE